MLTRGAWRGPGGPRPALPLGGGRPGGMAGIWGYLLRGRLVAGPALLVFLGAPRLQSGARDASGLRLPGQRVWNNPGCRLHVPAWIAQRGSLRCLLGGGRVSVSLQSFSLFREIAKDSRI